MERDLVELRSLDSIPYCKEVEVYGAESDWQTPGIYLASSIKDHPSVRLIGEKYYPDYLQTIVIIDDDPEELLDRIFSLEKELREKFKKINFDIRIRVISTSEDINQIKKTLFLRYERI